MEGEGEESLMTRAVGSSILPLLGAVLIILKVLGIITVSWWIVTAPFWVPFLIFLTFMPFVVGLLIVAAVTQRNTATRAADITNLNRLK